ncbi:MAG: MFS transporter, partial [Dehalococcoidia bacterium]
SRVIALMTATQIVGQISGGILGDRFDKRIIAMTCMVVHCVALLLLAFAVNIAMVIAFAMLHGWAWGTRGPLMQAMRADYFGTSNFGKIMGLSSMIVTIGNTTGPLLAGIVADRTGNYEVGFTILAIGALLGSLFFLAAKKPAPPQRSAVLLDEAVA